MDPKIADMILTLTRSGFQEILTLRDELVVTLKKVKEIGNGNSGTVWKVKLGGLSDTGITTKALKIFDVDTPKGKDGQPLSPEAVYSLYNWELLSLATLNDVMTPAPKQFPLPSYIESLAR